MTPERINEIICMLQQSRKQKVVGKPNVIIPRSLTIELEEYLKIQNLPGGPVGRYEFNLKEAELKKVKNLVEDIYQRLLTDATKDCIIRMILDRIEND